MPRQRDGRGRFTSASAEPEAEPEVPGSFEEPRGGSSGSASQGEDQAESSNETAGQERREDTASTGRGGEATGSAGTAGREEHGGEQGSASTGHGSEAVGSAGMARDDDIPAFDGIAPTKLAQFDTQTLCRENVGVWKSEHEDFLSLQNCWDVVQLTCK